MWKINELDRVEETKHLVPNIPNIVKALFGLDAYFIDWRKKLTDWATEKDKYGDGIVWLPWSRELWIVEVEWKERSNFFDQVRAFAGGKIDKKKLIKQLRECIISYENILNEVAPNFKEGLLLDNIINETIKNHVENDELKAHGWVVLGHDGNNIERLKNSYERELKARFYDSKQKYILSMARMFQGDCLSFILLEQYFSQTVQAEKSILIPAVTQTSSVQISKPEFISQKEDSPKGRNSPPEVIAHLRDVESHLWKISEEREEKVESKDIPLVTNYSSVYSENYENYFKELDNNKIKKIQNNIIEREELWRAFLDKKQMTIQEFHNLSHFSPKAIAGFLKWITMHRIAFRFGNQMSINEKMINS